MALCDRKQGLIHPCGDLTYLHSPVWAARPPAPRRATGGRDPATRHHLWWREGDGSTFLCSVTPPLAADQLCVGNLDVHRSSHLRLLSAAHTHARGTEGKLQRTRGRTGCAGSPHFVTTPLWR
jgi:hypothetical protein